MPSIGPGTSFTDTLRTHLESIEDPVKGKFVINNKKILGEAEHQIMKYIQDHQTTFRGKEILLASPDADLILLSFINKVKGLNIDLMRVDKMNDENFDFKVEDFNLYNTENISPFYLIVNYISIDTLLRNMRLYGANQKIIDISFILLLLGDDFLPKIPTLQIGNLGDIIKAYDDSRVNVINEVGGTKVLNYASLLTYLTNLIAGGKEQTWAEDVKKTFNRKIKQNKMFALDNFEKYASIKMFKPINVNELSGKRQMQFYHPRKYIGWFLENKGMYNPSKIIPREVIDYKEISGRPTRVFHSSFERRFNSVFKPMGDLFPLAAPVDRTAYEAKLKNYLEGYSFILDIYLNNNLKNYEWVYNYGSSPTITEIINFMTGKSDAELDSIFNYVTPGVAGNNIYEKMKFMNVENYRRFLDDSKLELIKELAKKIIEAKVVDPRFKASKLTELESMTKERILSAYMTYDNVPIIFDCSDSFYLNKCLEGHVLGSIRGYESDIRNIDGNLEYEKKYLKYKAKYLALKKMLKDANYKN